MINASSDFIEKLKKGGTVVNYADITLSDGTVLNLEPKDFMVTGNSITDKTSNGKWGIGNVIGKICTINIANHNGQFSGYDFYKSIIYLYIAMELDDGTIEKIHKGKFLCVTPSTKGETITISGVDDMCKLDKPYDTELAYPATLKEIVTDIALKCGIKISSEFLFPYYILTVEQKPKDTTYRQVLSWVAQVAGGYFRMSPTDYLEYAFYPEEVAIKQIYDGGDTYDKTNEELIDGGNFIDYEAENIIDGGDFFDYTDDDGYTHYADVKSLTISTDDVQVTGINIVNGKEAKLYGEADYAIEIKNNPFIVGYEDIIGAFLLNRISKYKIRPLSAQIRNNPLVEPYDVGYVHDRKGNQYFVCINSITYNTSGYTTIECLAEDPLKNASQYYSETAAEVVQVRRETDEKLSLYEQAVQNMNMLAANSMGVFTSNEVLEDGSTIFYMHNKPRREESNIIYKMTEAGFFISQDGGESYTEGFDSEGNAVLNVLSVIGITFDWARGGTLSLGGDNNQNGEIYIYDKEGVLCGRINNNGISLFSDKTGMQILLSPLIGLRQRDADGNEFYGLFYEKIVTDFPSADQTLLSTRYQAYDLDTLNYECYKTEYHPPIGSIPGIVDPFPNGYTVYFYRYYYVHNGEGWIRSDYPQTYNYTYTETTFELPISYKDKEWVINYSVDYDSFKLENILNEVKNVGISYLSIKPKCKAVAGLSWYGETNDMIGAPLPQLTNGYDEASKYTGVDSPYAPTPPTPSSYLVDISDYVYDKALAVVTESRPTTFKVKVAITEDKENNSIKVGVNAVFTIVYEEQVIVVNVNEAVAVKVQVVC